MSADPTTTEANGELSENDLDGVVGGSKVGDFFKKVGHEIEHTAVNAYNSVMNSDCCGSYTTDNGGLQFHAPKK